MVPEPVSTSSISTTACRQEPGKEEVKFPRTDGSSCCRDEPCPPGAAGRAARPGQGGKLPRGRDAGDPRSRAGVPGWAGPELSVVLRAGRAPAARIGAGVPGAGRAGEPRSLRDIAWCGESANMPAAADTRLHTALLQRHGSFPRSAHQ